jgi:hypothetical protein
MCLEHAEVMIQIQKGTMCQNIYDVLRKLLAVLCVLKCWSIFAHLKLITCSQDYR